MLTRFTLKRNFRLITRCLSDKPSDDNDETHTLTEKHKPQNEDKKAESNTEKIQALLKSMMAKPKVNESEYREKFATAPDVRKRKPKSDEIEIKTEKIEESLTKAAGEVAQAIGGDVKHTESELLSKVLGKINQTSTSLSDLIIGMKVDHTKDKDDPMKMETRGQQVKRIISKTKVEAQNTRFAQRKERQPAPRGAQMRSLPQVSTVNIFSGEPLGIFKAKGHNYGTTLDVWESLKQRELALATSQPPANYFQKMILWTNQGKVWKFPIDNEQGLEEEQNISFTEHVFLDAHLEDWCPKKGPIRHFMELVCTGLSKNPFYTAQEKKDHIMWYKEYFESKKSLLEDVGAWSSAESSSEKSA